ncbi:hypothetical protein AB0A60_35660 [Streptomyces sp. NPDC046275]|uniref:hypothetical protein n=1 Tax=Streptomyces sp. NPDC046275 TaxID=3157201 RepID=UPI0033D862DC
MERTTFPPDLLDAQARWIAVYEALAQDRPARTTALRHRLLGLSTQVYFHPYWNRPAAGGRPELLLAARAAQAGREVTAR